jgi:uncharacterized membrane protein
MNGVHLHLLLNHFPIIGSIFASGFLIAGLIWKSNHLLHGAYALIIISALFSVGAYITGEEAEHAVEKIIGINHDALEEHEESAEISMWVLILTGALSLGTVAAYKKAGSYSKVLVIITLIAMLVSTALMIHTGKEGGLVRHSEILRTDL